MLLLLFKKISFTSNFGSLVIINFLFGYHLPRTNGTLFLDKEGDKKAQKILQELENIDDECEEKDIDFIKTSDDGIQKEYDLPTLPALAFYRHRFRDIYKGDLMHEEAILDWVLGLRDSSPEVIENVDRKTLQVNSNFDIKVN